MYANKRIMTRYCPKSQMFLLLTLCVNGLLSAQKEVIELWENGVPNAVYAGDYKEVYEEAIGKMSKVTNPSLTVYVPKNPNGTAVIICPGGGYEYLSIQKEGYKTAEWFNAIGITAFVLKYRLPNDIIMENKAIGPLQDAQESVRYIRRNASRWNVDPGKIGVLGYSAGGHLAATLSTKFNEKVYENSDDVSARPDFSLLIYPVISMTSHTTHKGSKNKLLGKDASAALVDQFSTEKLITPETPPAFLAHAVDDKAVIVENSLLYFVRLRESGINAELHMYQSGGHGFGLGKDGTSKSWTEDCKNWLQANQFLN